MSAWTTQRRLRFAAEVLAVAVLVFVVPLPVSVGFCDVATHFQWQVMYVTCGHAVALTYWVLWLGALFGAVALLSWRADKLGGRS